MSNDRGAMHLLDLPGGGVLEYVLDEGAPSGSALLVYHHGTPSAGPLDPLVLEAARSAGLQAASVIRPGYGRSTRSPGRTVADVAALSAALAAHLGHERFVTAGWSGGGPHAIATAALLPGRCRAALSIGGIAPFDADGLDYVAGMGQENIDEFEASVVGGEPLEEMLTAASADLAHVTGSDLIAAMDGLLPESDRALLRTSYSEALADELRWSVANGIWGWFDDDIAFVRSWGFEIADVAAPVIILQGSEDLMVPYGHGKWLAEHLPSSEPHLVDGEGHLSIAVGRLEAAMHRLRSVLD